jgi:hypothetical protein
VLALDGELEIGQDAGGRYYIVADRIYNRQGQWDWYQIGGRWAGSLLLRPGASGACGQVSPFHEDRRHIELAEDMLAYGSPRRVDQARKRDVDWEGMQAGALARAEAVWAEAEQLGNARERHWRLGIVPGETREAYIHREGRWHTRVVVHEGHWYKREVGADSASSNYVPDEQAEDRWHAEFVALVDSRPDNTLLTVADCHV